jgi:hypothetical protein
MTIHYLPHETCIMPLCSEVALLGGCCGHHWNKRTVHRIARMNQVVKESREAILICAQLLANRHLKFVLQ